MNTTIRPNKHKTQGGSNPDNQSNPRKPSCFDSERLQWVCLAAMMMPKTNCYLPVLGGMMKLIQHRNLGRARMSTLPVISWIFLNFPNRLLGLSEGCLQLRGSSGSSSSSSNDEAGVGSKLTQSTGEADMKLSVLQSLHARDETMDRSCYARNGKNSKRLKELLRSPPCECECRVEFNLLRETCKAFWALPKESQDALLWSLQSGSGSRRKKWSIEGSLSYHLCFNSFLLSPDKFRVWGVVVTVTVAHVISLS